MNRFGRILASVATLAVLTTATAEAQLDPALNSWLNRPNGGCATSSCVINTLPTARRSPGRDPMRPWPVVGGPGPITTTPEPLTMALLGTGLAGIGLAARRRKSAPPA